MNKPSREHLFSFLTVITVMSAPLIFTILQSHEFPTPVSLAAFFGTCIVGFFFQGLRLRETHRNRLRTPYRLKDFYFRIGDEVKYNGNHFVVLKHGFNHYYLREINAEKVILVKKNRIESPGRAS